jgi:hypothetical protein
MLCRANPSMYVRYLALVVGSGLLYFVPLARLYVSVEQSDR